MSADEHAAYHADEPILDPQVADHAARLQRAEIVVFVYPTWWSGLPAILKGWLERVMVPGVGFRSTSAAARFAPALHQVRRIVGISTWGSPRRLRLAVNDNGRRILTRALRMSCGGARGRRGWRCTRMATTGDRPARVPRPCRTTDGSADEPGARRVLPPRPRLVRRRGARSDAGRTRAGDARRARDDLYADGFDPVLRRGRTRSYDQPGVAARLQSYVDDLTWAEMLVLVYPTWWSGQPAMLKGWIDRVWAAGVAWELPEGARVARPLLQEHPPHRGGHHPRIVEARQRAGGREPANERRPGRSGSMCSRRTRTTWCALYGIDTSPSPSASRSSNGSSAHSPSLSMAPASVGDRYGDLGCDGGVVLGQCQVGRHAATLGCLDDPAEHERRDAAPVMPAASHSASAAASTSSSSRDRARRRGIGTPTSTPLPAARSAGRSRRPRRRLDAVRTGRPDERV